jgi:hypothetical protein
MLIPQLVRENHSAALHGLGIAAPVDGLRVLAE